MEARWQPDAQAALQGNDGLETFVAGSGQSAEARLHFGCAEQGVDSGHDLYLDGRSLAHQAVVIDLFNREIVGWSLKPRMTTDIVMDALTMAWFRRKPEPGLMHHSDRGSQYASHAFQAQLKEYGMVCSMSRKGNCWDNAPTESFFNSLKNERVHGTRYRTKDEAKADLFDYIEPFYNRKRKHSTLGYAPPRKSLEDWLSSQHEKELAA